MTMVVNNCGQQSPSKHVVFLPVNPPPLTTALTSYCPTHPNNTIGYKTCSLYIAAIKGDSQKGAQHQSLLHSTSEMHACVQNNRANKLPIFKSWKEIHKVSMINHDQTISFLDPHSRHCCLPVANSKTLSFIVNLHSKGAQQQVDC